MLALSTMHDHNFHSGPILLSNSPPHPHMHASHALMSQDGFKQSSRLESQIPGQQQATHQAQNHGRYSQLQSQPHHNDIGHYDVDHPHKDVKQTMTYPAAWQYNNDAQQHHQQQHQQQQHQQHQQQQQHRQQHQSHQIVSDPSRRIVQNMNNGGQDEREMYQKREQPFSVPSMAYSSSHHVGRVEFEDVEEDDISDLEEEEELRRSYELYRQQLHRPDVTSRLLIFADVISTELKKYFGRTKDQEDSCDVYEDKWATTKSGRELYYADLLRIAQGDMEPASKTVQKTSASSAASTSSYSSSSPSLSPKVDVDNRCAFKGVRDDSIGMGPLTELFEYGLKDRIVDKRGISSPGAKSKEISKHTSSKNSKFQMLHNNDDISYAVPMHERNLPESFWKEPGTGHTSSSSDSHRETVQHGGMLASSRLPDFSDLVESWQGNVEGMEVAHNAQRLNLNLNLEQGRF